MGQRCVSFNAVHPHDSSQVFDKKTSPKRPSPEHASIGQSRGGYLKLSQLYIPGISYASSTQPRELTWFSLNFISTQDKKFLVLNVLKFQETTLETLWLFVDVFRPSQKFHDRALKFCSIRDRLSHIYLHSLASSIFLHLHLQSRHLVLDTCSKSCVIAIESDLAPLLQQ